MVRKWSTVPISLSYITPYLGRVVGSAYTVNLYLYSEPVS
jgi:hypothetical protein